MEAEKIEVIKDWLKPKSVYNIQIFLGFANFYWQFIQDFKRIAALFIAALKTIRSFDKLAPNNNNGSKLVFSKNNDSRPISEKNNSNNKVDRYSFSKNSMEHAKKSEKSKSEKMFKS